MQAVDDRIALGPTRVSNTWLLRDAGGRRFLVDTGHRVERRALVRGLARAGVRGPGDLTAILLTHRHSDHAGNAGYLRERFRCPVVCHEADAAPLSGAAERAPLAGRGAMVVHEVLCRVEDRFPARSEVDEVFGETNRRWGFVEVPVPGHTEGSSLLLHEPTGALFSGDAILAGFPVQRTLARLRLAVPEYSLDVERCRAHALDYLATDPEIETLCAGHGPPIRRRVRQRLRALLAQPR